MSHPVDDILWNEESVKELLQRYKVRDDIEKREAK
jgi:hypothetical protein